MTSLSPTLSELTPARRALACAALLLAGACKPDGPPDPRGECEPELAYSWACGLTSARTGEPLIFVGGEHAIDPATVSYGYNIVVDAQAAELRPSAAPLVGGESLLLTETAQDDHNVREYARVVSIMAPIRDALLYHFEETTREEWLALTEVLPLNGIKTEDAPELTPQAILSTAQVWDWAASQPIHGSPVAACLVKGLE